MRLSAMAVVSALISAIATAAGLPFPGTEAARSPDQKWELRSEAPDNGGEHKLLLRDVNSGSTRPVLTFGRHVDALWAPDSGHIAVTDYVGSDNSDCKIVNVKGGRVTSILGSLDGSSIAWVVKDNHHAFVKCSRWRSSNIVEIEVDAYGDANPHGVTKRARFDVKRLAVVD